METKRQFPQRIRFHYVLISLAVSSAILFSHFLFHKRISTASLDVLFRTSSRVISHPRIVIIEIDDENVSKIGGWPLKRQWFAAMTKVLKELGAKTVFFDVIFSEPSSQEDDQLFQQALRYAGNVYLPFAFTTDPPQYTHRLEPIELFTVYSKGVGSINIEPDADGIIRRIPLVFREKDQLYPHIVLEIAMDYHNIDIEWVTDNEFILSGKDKTVRIPLVDNDFMLINWSGRWGDVFSHYSFLDVLAAYNTLQSKGELSSDMSAIKDGICVVGVTATGIQDIRSVPLQSEYPGIGVIATALSTIIDQDFIYPVPRWIFLFCMYLLAVLVAFIFKDIRPLWTLVFVLVCSLCLVGGSYVLFVRPRIWFDFFPSLAALWGSYACIVMYNFFKNMAERQYLLHLAVTDELTGLCNIRYFKLLLKEECHLAKIDPNRQFCLLMLDIDHFKNFNDTYGHQIGDLVLKETSAVLKKSVRASDVVARYGGEEIIVLLRGIPLSGASRIVAEKIRRNIEVNSVEKEHVTYRVTVSIGVAQYEDDDHIDTMIKRADMALYQAKEQGRNRIEVMEKK